MKHEKVIQNGKVILATGVVTTDIAIDQGKITALGTGLAGHETIDAGGLIIAPGMVDAHVHITEDGGGLRDDWEGYVSGTRAAAKGGVTSLIEMPLNQLPATVNGETLALKYASGKGKLKVDVASLGGVEREQPKQDVREEDALGACGYFIATCGERPIPTDFNLSDDETLYQAMQEIAAHDKVLALHTENEAMTKAGESAAKSAGKKSLQDFVDSHSVLAEVEAIRRVVLLAKETGCRLHITHVSSHEGIEEVCRAKAEGVDITSEICTHYLYFNSDDVDFKPSLLKCAPPVRGMSQQAKLWQDVMDGKVDIIASDHASCPEALKDTGNIFTDWSGVAGLQSSVEAMFDEMVQRRGLPLTRFAKLMATNAAQRFDLVDKGEIAIGKDADLVFINPNQKHVLSAADLEYRHQISPYLNREFGAKVVATYLRGNCIYSEEQGVSDAFTGEFLKIS